MLRNMCKYAILYTLFAFFCIFVSIFTVLLTQRKISGDKLFLLLLHHGTV